MMLIATILPIIILLVIAIFLRFIVQYFRNNKSNVFVRKLNWFLSGYLIVLLAATILSAFLIKDERVINKEKFESEVEKDVAEFHDAIYRGDIEKIDSELLTARYNFEFKGRTLKVEESNNEFFEVPIVVEEKALNDGLIEAQIYTSKSFFRNIDITKQILPFSVDLQRETLLVTSPARNEIKFKQLTKEFPIRQFTGEKMMSGGHDTIGETVLYLRVPKGVLVESSDNIYIEYVLK